MNGQLVIPFEPIQQFQLKGQMKGQSYISHVLNTSKSKQANAFPRAPRFPTSCHISTEAIYVLPNTKTKRATSFGFGSKISLACKERSPPPGSYKLPSDFEKDNLTNTTSIHYGREKVTFGSFLLETLKQKRNLPGPEKYLVARPFKTIGGKMGRRIETDYDIKVKNTPGPGSYQLKSIQLGNKGHYALSTIKNSTSPRYCSGHSFSIKNRRQPAPFYYDVQEKQVGKHQVSLFPNVPNCLFPKAPRPSLADRSKASLPGAKYRSFSQFGN